MPEPMICSYLPSPIGELLLVSNGEALTGVYMTPHPGGPRSELGRRRDDERLRPAREQLRAYFAGELLDSSYQKGVSTATYSA